MSGETKGAIVSGIIIALVTASANWYFTQMEISTNLKAWRVQFSEQNEWTKKDKAHEKFGEIINHHQKAANHFSAHAENLVEYNFYDIVANITNNESDPVIKQMRSNQAAILLNEKIVINSYKSSVSEYEWRITYLGRWTDSNCTEVLLKDTKESFDISPNFQSIILKAMEEAPNTKARPHEFINHLKINTFKDYISTEDEVSNFRKGAEKCFEELLK